jgi:hypothetical protein
MFNSENIHISEFQVLLLFLKFLMNFGSIWFSLPLTQQWGDFYLLHLKLKYLISMGSGQTLWDDKGIWSMRIFPSIQAAFISSLGFCNDYYK